MLLGRQNRLLLMGILSCLVSAMAICAVAQTNSSAPQKIYNVVVNASTPQDKANYYTTLLSMILNASKKPNEVIQLQYNDKQYTQARWIAELQSQKTHSVLWTVTTKEREQSLRAIKVPILKDLFGKRLLIIRKGDQYKFDNIKTKKELARLTAGQGSHWPDADVFAANKLPFTLGIAKTQLYQMLAAKRFDYFPRSVAEINNELSLIEENGLVVENELMLTYPANIYYFVNKNDTDLAQRLEKGWEIILANGEFETFYLNSPRVKAALIELNKHSRRIIKLDNPFTTDDIISE